MPKTGMQCFTGRRDESKYKFDCFVFLWLEKRSCFCAIFSCERNSANRDRKTWNPFGPWDMTCLKLLEPLQQPVTVLCHVPSCPLMQTSMKRSMNNMDSIWQCGNVRRSVEIRRERGEALAGGPSKGPSRCNRLCTCTQCMLHVHMGGSKTRLKGNPHMKASQTKQLKSVRSFLMLSLVGFLSGLSISSMLESLGTKNVRPFEAIPPRQLQRPTGYETSVLLTSGQRFFTANMPLALPKHLQTLVYNQSTS